jgi:hypothetical protein
MARKEDVPLSTRWARLRFAVVSPLLASPPKKGELQQRLEELAATEYVHPATGAPVRFGKSTIEHWLYTVRDEADPLRALTRKVHAQAGQHPSVSIAQGEAIKLQYKQHPSWSYKLHSDNLEALALEDDSLGEFPGYATVRRYMKSRGFFRQRRIKRKLDRGENGVPVQIVHARAKRQTRGLLGTGRRPTHGHARGRKGETLRRAFRMQVTRKQRRSDGTITVLGVRFEIPARYRVFEKLCVRYARWDLSSIDLVDPRSGVHLARILPLDKARNADGKRRILKNPDDPLPMTPSPDSGIAPALRALMRDYAATGLPPAYLPKDDYRGSNDLDALQEVTQ